MTTSPDIVLRQNESVATVVINRPAVQNSLTWSAMTELRATLAAVKRDESIRVLVVEGAGGRSFCVGADLTGMASGASALDLHDGRGEVAGIISDLWSLGKPTIAKVRGWCLAGGFGLALACDVVLASETATFGTPEIDRGLWPYMITVPMLRSMPAKVALELQMTGRKVSAAEAERIGFARMVSNERLEEEVAALAERLASKSMSAMRLGRDAFYSVCDLRADAALRVLHPLLTVHTSLNDAREGLAAFAEHRAPLWTDT